MIAVILSSGVAQPASPSEQVFIFFARDLLPPTTRNLFVGLANPTDQALPTPLRFRLQRRVGRRWVTLGRIEGCGFPKPTCDVNRLLPAAQRKNEGVLAIQIPPIPRHSVLLSELRLANWRPGRYRIDADYFLRPLVDIRGAEFEIRPGAPDNPKFMHGIRVMPSLIEHDAPTTVNLSQNDPPPSKQYDICRYVAADCEKVGVVPTDATGRLAALPGLPAGLYALQSDAEPRGYFVVSAQPVGRLDSIEPNGAFIDVATCGSNCR